MKKRSGFSGQKSSATKSYDKDFHKKMIGGNAVNFSLGASKRTRNKVLGGIKNNGLYATSGPFASDSSSTGTGFFGQKTI